ncbi:MAG TPA: protein kinase [Gemmatimonadaceae bacterium]
MTDVRHTLAATLGDAYRIDRELGGGGMSRVFAAEERALGRRVVVKVLSPELGGGVNIERFKREIQTAAQLQHAHIVPVLIAGQTGDLPFYTMPYVDGESLRARLGRSGALPLNDTVSILRDVARALAYAHERGIVHRDIKPDNVMLSGGSAVVTDFGIAKAISAARTGDGNATLTQVGQSIGTPAYMAPEQAAGDPSSDHRSDLYAFGCMAYEMLAGQPPFIEKSPQQLLAAHMGREPEPLLSRRPDTPPALASLVMRCLEKDAADRPRSANEIARTLETVTSGGTHPGMPPVLLGSPGMLSRALVVYAAAFVGVALLAKLATVVVGLPDWVFPGALVVMALGLPMILLTSYVQRATQCALESTPTYTPGGTMTLGAGTMATMAVKANPHMSWRRTARGGFLAMGGFVLLVVAFMVTRALGIGPAASLLSSGQLTESDQILVADFAAAGPDAALGSVLGEALRTSLSRSQRVRIVQASGVAGALRRMERPLDTPVDSALAMEMAQRDGLKAIVAGNLTAAGTSYLVSVRLIAAATGDVLASFQESARDATDLISVIDGLGRDLRGKIGESLRDVQAAPALTRVTTGSLEALRKFTEGARFNDILSQPAKAIAPLEEAIRLDSNFAMAYRKLAISLNSTGDWRRAGDVIERGYALRDRIPEAERLALLGVYHMYSRNADRAKVIENYEELFRKYPEWHTIITTDLLATAYMSRQEYAKAESLWAVAIERAPDENSPWSDIIRAQAAQGKLDEALQSARRAGGRDAQKFAEVEAGNVHYNAGRLDSAAATYERVIAVGGEGRGYATQELSRLRAIEGRLREAGELNTSRQAGMLRALFVLGDSAEARKQFDEWVSRRPDSLTPLDYALVQAEFEAVVGRPGRARTLVQEFDAEAGKTWIRSFHRSQREWVMGWIAMAERRFDDAVTAFRNSEMRPDGPADACAICWDWATGLAFDRGARPDSAIAKYERYLNTPWLFRLYDDSYIRAWVLRRLGELYEAKNEPAKAEQYYRQFVEQWRNADPVLQPQVTEVRNRLTRLAEAARRRG